MNGKDYQKEFQRRLNESLSKSANRVCEKCGIAWPKQGMNICEACYKERDTASGLYGAGVGNQQLIDQAFAAQQRAIYQPQLMQMLQSGLFGTGLGNTATPHERDADEEPSETVVGPILAYRYWDITADDKMLHSVTAGFTWQPFEVVDGKNDFGPFPNRDRFVGVYAYKDINACLNDDGGTVSGGVWLWGKVVEYTEGWRAEFAYPAFFYCYEEDEAACDCAPFTEYSCYWEDLTALSKKYKVPILVGPDKPTNKTEELTQRLLFKDEEQ